MYAAILAGGSGTRLWPRSRLNRPKQLLNLVDDNDTMLQKTVKRILPLVPEENILVMTGHEYAQMVHEQVPGLPLRNIIAEPAARGTAPCTGLAAIHLQHLISEKTGQEMSSAADVMIMLHADAHIEEEEEFRQILRAAVEAAQAGHLVTTGIVPRYPETGFGYIQRGELLAQINGRSVYRVKRFTEKPDYESAQAFVQSGQYYWNSGIFIWKLSSILLELERCQPRLYAQLRAIQAAFGAPGSEETLQRVWAEIQPQTIDVGVMEQARDVVVIPAEIGWSDVGSWASVADIRSADADGNVLLGEGSHLGLGTRDSLVYSSRRLIATIGLQDMIVVDTDDAILICPKERAQDVKKLVDQLKKDKRTEYC
jgi:mannose-1-phosphate guanylyltransferase